MVDPTMVLSALAERRRVELRAQLVPLVVRRRRLRRARSLAIAVIAVALAWRAFGGGSIPMSRTPMSASPTSMIAFVHDDPEVVARYRVAASDRVVRLGDDDLTRVLTGAGRAEGLLRIDGRVVLAGLVVDSWRSANEGP